MRETYEQIVERRMNERARGIQKSIELHAKEKGVTITGGIGGERKRHHEINPGKDRADHHQ